MKKNVRMLACCMAAGIFFTTSYLPVNASGVNKVLPSGGVNLTILKGHSLDSVASEDAKAGIEETMDPLHISKLEDEKTALASYTDGDESFSNLVIANVDTYVNVRDLPGLEGKVVGKLYDDSVGDLLEVSGDWYKIRSGDVVGYVKGEYCVTGEDAIDLAKEVGTRLAIVNDTVKVRKEADASSEEWGVMAKDEMLLVVDEEDPKWVAVDIEEGTGYIAREYVDLKTQFVHAESAEAEAARLLKEKAERQAAQAAARAAMANAPANTQASAPAGSAGGYTGYSADGSIGSDVIAFAVQFVGNPYVWGGTSLTNGCDCSGFVMSVYANFGVELPHASNLYSGLGYAVDGGLANAIPGDIVVYSGHVALYMGDNQIVHASTPKGGIKISNADYRQPICVRRIF